MVQLGFIDDSSLKDNNEIQKTLDEEIQELENLKNQLNTNINDLNEQESKLKADIKDTVNHGCWPVPGFKDISSPFGYEIHPISKEKSYIKV